MRPGATGLVHRGHGGDKAATKHQGRFGEIQADPFLIKKFVKKDGIVASHNICVRATIPRRNDCRPLLARRCSFLNRYGSIQLGSREGNASGSRPPAVRKPYKEECPASGPVCHPTGSCNPEGDVSGRRHRTISPAGIYPDASIPASVIKHCRCRYRVDARRRWWIRTGQ